MIIQESERHSKKTELTNTISPCIEFERLRGVNGEQLLFSIKNDRIINFNFITTSSQQGQRDSPDRLVVLFFCRPSLQEAILADMNAVLVLNDSEDREADLIQETSRWSWWV